MKKKILYVHHGASEGGAPRSLLFLLEKLDRNIYEPYVLCIKDKKNIKKFEEVGAKVIFDDRMGPFHGSTVSPMTLKQIINNFIYLIPTFYYIKKHIRRVKPDLIHLNSTCLFVMAYSIKKMDSSIPIICHVREPVLKNIWGEIIKKYNKKNIDYFISIDRFDAERMDLDKSEYEVIYNSVDFKKYNPNVESNHLREKFNIDSNDTIFLYLARIAPANGALEMVKSLRKNLRSNMNMHFIVAGFNSSDSYSNEVKEICKTIDNVHTLSFNDKVVDMIASSDVMVCPFVKPHFARAIIEAGAIGIPSIGSNIGGPNELIIDKKTGILFNYENFDDFFKSCIIISQNNKFRNYLSKNAIINAKNKFDLDINTKKTVEIYNKFL